MGRCTIQIVMGPAGSGKSTYCHAMQQHCATLGRLRRRTVHVANLDPAAEEFSYDVAFDVRDLVSVPEVMEELQLGPNGALLYCMEYLLEHAHDWLQQELDEFDDDEYYLILDCPGQVELYSHVPVMRRLVEMLRTWGYDRRVVGVFCVDATFCVDASKFISGSLLALSAMVALELPHVNVLTKCDLVDEDFVEDLLNRESAADMWGAERIAQDDNNDGDAMRRLRPSLPPAVSGSLRRRHALTEAIVNLVDDFSMVSFVPLNLKDEESLDYVLTQVDHTIQYGEDLEVRGADDNEDVVDDLADDDM